MAPIILSEINNTIKNEYSLDAYYYLEYKDREKCF